MLLLKFFHIFDKVSDEAFSHHGHDGFRMKLNALGGVFQMAKAHDLSIIGSCRHRQALGQGLFRHCKGVVAHGGKGFFDPFEDELFIPRHHGGFAVHDPFGLHNIAAKTVGNGLMPETNSQNGNFSGKMVDDLHGDTGIFGSAGAGRDDNTVRLKGFNVRHGGFVVPKDIDRGTGLYDVVHQVEGEGIKVVNGDYLHGAPPLLAEMASFMARSTLLALLIHS